MHLLFRGILILFAGITSYASNAETVSVNGVMINYEVKGEGDTLVMLHSGMMSRDDMRVQIDYFSQFYKVIAIDAREQGRSTSSPDQITYELMASDVIGVLDHEGITNANIFGQSDGGITALMISHLYPDRVIKSVIHGAVYNHSAYPDEQKQGWLNSSFSESDQNALDPGGFPGMAIPHYLKGKEDLADFETHLKEMSLMWATQPNLTKAELSKIEVPTLVIVGDRYDISIRHTLDMHEALPNSELFVAPGATHFIHQEKPDMLHRVVHDFVKE